MRSLLLLALALCLAAPAPAFPSAPRASAPPKGGTLVVYYFYRQPRCTSCVALESQTVAALTEGFSDRMRSGQIVWKPVDIGEKGNAHFEKDYRLESSSVVLVHVVKGKRGGWKRLDRIWDIGLKDKAGVATYITDEVTSALKRWKLER